MIDKQHVRNSAAISTALLLFLCAGYAQSAARVTVAIVSREGEYPIERVLTTLFSTEWARSATSDAAGRVTFDDVPDGKYEMQFSGEGWKDLNRNVEISNGSERSITARLDLGAAIPDMRYCGPHLTIRYQAPTTDGQIRGFVHEGPTPVSKAKVTIGRPGEKKPFARTRSDAAGQFALAGLTPGEYILDLSAFSYNGWHVTELKVPRNGQIAIDLPLRKAGELPMCQ